MAKKKRNSILDSVMSTVSVDITNTLSEEKLEEAENKNPIDVSIENKAEKIEVHTPIKLEDVSTKNDELIRLSKENSDLTDKLAIYIQEISDLKAKINDMKDKIDKNLIKISELTFENTTLQAKIVELSNKNNIAINSSNSFSPIRQSTNVSYNQISRQTNFKNGYSDWN